MMLRHLRSAVEWEVRYPVPKDVGASADVDHAKLELAEYSSYSQKVLDILLKIWPREHKANSDLLFRVGRDKTHPESL